MINILKVVIKSAGKIISPSKQPTVIARKFYDDTVITLSQSRPSFFTVSVIKLTTGSKIYYRRGGWELSLWRYKRACKKYLK